MTGSVGSFAGARYFVSRRPVCAGQGNRADRPSELTLDELRAKVVRSTGSDFGMRDPRWPSRFGNATRQAARYRAGAGTARR
ncbi:hypothetical protein [Streptomyces sp. NPDC003710]